MVMVVIMMVVMIMVVMIMLVVVVMIMVMIMIIIVLCLRFVWLLLRRPSSWPTYHQINLQININSKKMIPQIIYDLIYRDSGGASGMLLRLASTSAISSFIASTSSWREREPTMASR